MAKYIPNSAFQSLVSDIQDPYSDEGWDKFQSILRSDEMRESLNGYSTEDINHFITSFEYPEILLFRTWIERSKPLLNALTIGAKGPFIDDRNLLEHKLANKFKIFVSPYLTLALLGRQPQSEKELVLFASFFSLLNEDHRSVVEAQLFKGIKKRLDGLAKDSFRIDTEQELVNRIKPLCSDDIIRVVNSFSKANYALKIYYVDNILGAVESIGCTARFANWLIKQMEQLELNNEHKERVMTLRHEIKSGKLEVKNRPTGRTPIRWRALVSVILFLVIVGSVFYIIYYKPFSSPDEYGNMKNSSFKALSVEERKKVDSLVKEMNASFNPDEIEIDPGISYGGGMSLQLRKAFDNELMEKLYQDLALDASLANNYQQDTCEVQNDFKQYPGVTNLRQRTNGKSCFFKNESEYDCIVYVAEPNKSGKVFSTRVRKGETIQFKMRTHELMTVAIGDEYGRFLSPPGSSASEQPSSDYAYHFCFRDGNFEESINRTYRLKAGSNAQRFALIGKRGTMVRFEDINNSLEDY